MITVISTGAKNGLSDAYLIKANGGGDQMELALWVSIFFLQWTIPVDIPNY